MCDLVFYCFGVLDQGSQTWGRMWPTSAFCATLDASCLKVLV